MSASLLSHSLCELLTSGNVNEQTTMEGNGFLEGRNASPSNPLWRSTVEFWSPDTRKLIHSAKTCDPCQHPYHVKVTNISDRWTLCTRKGKEIFNFSHPAVNPAKRNKRREAIIRLLPWIWFKLISFTLPEPSLWFYYSKVKSPVVMIHNVNRWVKSVIIKIPQRTLLSTCKKKGIKMTQFWSSWIQTFRTADRSDQTITAVCLSVSACLSLLCVAACGLQFFLSPHHPVKLCWLSLPDCAWSFSFLFFFCSSGCPPVIHLPHVLPCLISVWWTCHHQPCTCSKISTCHCTFHLCFS